MSIIPCLTWVKRGVAERVPFKVEVDKAELRKLIEETKDNLEDLESENLDPEIDDADDAEEESAADIGETLAAAAPAEDAGKGSKKKKKKKAKKRKHEEAKEEEDVDDIVTKYGLDDYEEDQGDDEGLIGGMGGLSFYASNEEDPYITNDKEVDSDDEDNEIKPDDNLVIIGRSHKDHCFLEVYVYNETLGNLYVHHDYLLPSFPLAVEWLNFDPTDSSTGNYAAVATMEPQIEVWNLDVTECLEPACVLGNKKTKKKKKKKTGSSQAHTDSVLDLSWNSVVGNVLASASADHTVALWDLSNQTVATSIRQHTDKVQCVKWHPLEAQTLLSGGFDHTARVFDCRDPGENHKSWTLDGEVERVLWNKYSPVNFFASSDKGAVYYMDIRQDSKPLFTLAAHTKAVTGICLSSAISGLLLTTSTDKTMKVWDVETGKPSLVLERNMKMNELYCVEACPEAPFVFAFGGEKELKVWDIRESAKVRKHFLSRMSSELQAECAGDDKDLPGEGEDVLDTLMAAERDAEAEEKEMMEEMKATANPKKKKHKKKKKPTMDD